MQRYQWSRLNKQQVGAYAKLCVKTELTMYGFRVYETEVDDRGIDFVARYDRGPFLEIQVRSLRQYGYVFLEKSKFALKEHRYVAFSLLLPEGQPPQLYLIPAAAWRKPDGVFVDREYVGLKSKPEYGLNVSRKNMPALAQYALAETVDLLVKQAVGQR